MPHSNSKNSDSPRSQPFILDDSELEIPKYDLKKILKEFLSNPSEQNPKPKKQRPQV
jgi:hypothetical protein